MRLDWQGVMNSPTIAPLTGQIQRATGDGGAKDHIVLAL